MEKTGLHCWVSGRVQGVGYREATRRCAEKLGVQGWVRNLPDGRVEVMACGTTEQLEKLRRWLWQGPLLARVTDVVCEAVPAENFTDFVIR